MNIVLKKLRLDLILKRLNAMQTDSKHPKYEDACASVNIIIVFCYFRITLGWDSLNSFAGIQTYQ